MTARARAFLLALSAAFVAPFSIGAFELPAGTYDSLVSVLPVWPDRPQGGPDLPPGTAPEGSGVVYAEGGWLVTALHVVDTALSIDVRLAGGRRLPAELIARDPRTDIALLKVEADLPRLLPAAPPRVGQPVCAIGNVYGLGLAQSCGVVSALHRSNARFNPIEDFVQTDAAVNPGSSGGALVDRSGRLVGLLSAIFAGAGDGNIGVNFALSQPMLARVADDLIAYGEVRPVDPGLVVVSADPAEPPHREAVRATSVTPGGAAAAAGIEVGDLLVEWSGWPLRTKRDFAATAYLLRPGDRIAVTLLRDGRERIVELSIPED